MRYFFNISYDGTNYAGWQRQNNTRGRTVQEEIEKVLFSFFKEKITVYGCGRTDAGVHASQYAMHINLKEAPKFDLKFRMNKNLPSTIAIKEVFEVKENQHCRYDAQTRTYDYFLHWKKDPLLLRYSSFYEYSEDGLDFVAMKKVVELIGQAQDFKALCKQPELNDNTLCSISKCELHVNVEQARMRFSITSNRFLRGMVRYCIFFLLHVGSGKMTVNDFERILNREVEFIEKKPAHPNGLFLTEINYPFIKFRESNHLMRILKSGLE